MPKKVQRRGVKAKGPARRPAPRTARPVATESVPVDVAPAASTGPAVSTTGFTTAASAPAAAPASARRPIRGPRPAATATINYAYLSRDLTRLGILAPLMVVLVILAFIFQHALPG